MTAAETLAEARRWIKLRENQQIDRDLEAKLVFIVRALIALAERPAMPEEPDAETLARFSEAIGRALNTSVGSVSAYKVYRALYAHLKEQGRFDYWPKPDPYSGSHPYQEQKKSRSPEIAAGHFSHWTRQRNGQEHS